MSSNLTRALRSAFESAPSVKLVPCQITQVTPLQVTIMGAPNVPALKATGLTYTVGQAMALITQAGNPLVIPIS